MEPMTGPGTTAVAQPAGGADQRGLAEPAATAPESAVITGASAELDAAGLTTRLINLELRRLLYTEGLTEVVILTVGVQLGVVSPALFTIMVLMALVTTFMAAPLITVLKRRMATGRVPSPAGDLRGAGAGR